MEVFVFKNKIFFLHMSWNISDIRFLYVFVMLQGKIMQNDWLLKKKSYIKIETIE